MFPVPFPRQGWHPVAEVEIAPPLKATSASALGRCGPAERRAKRAHSFRVMPFYIFSHSYGWKTRNYFHQRDCNFFFLLAQSKVNTSRLLFLRSPEYLKDRKLGKYSYKPNRPECILGTYFPFFSLSRNRTTHRLNTKEKTTTINFFPASLFAGICKSTEKVQCNQYS